MKNYEKSVLYHRVLAPLQNRKKTITPKFYQDFILLSHNQNFREAVEGLRKKLDQIELAIFDPSNPIFMKHWQETVQNILNNPQKTNAVLSVAKRCLLWKDEKFKYPLTEAILAYTFYGELYSQISREIIFEKKRVHPLLICSFDDADEKVTVTLKISPSTTQADAIATLKENWETIAEYQKKYKKDIKQSPLRNFIRDYFYIYLPYLEGKRPDEINPSQETGSEKDILQPNAISKIINKIQKKIELAFNST